MDPTDARTAGLVAKAWEELTDAERGAALSVAREEARRAVREYLGVPAARRATPVALRRSPWAQEHGGLGGLPDDVLLLYASARTIPTGDRYIEAVVERLCPEAAERWWAREPEAGQTDPRVGAFCDVYERERCSILGINQPPTGMADLQLQLWRAKEQERERAREWFRTVETPYGSEEHAEMQVSVARFEYQRCQWVTDLAQILLDAATHCGLGERGRHGA